MACRAFFCDHREDCEDLQCPGHPMAMQLHRMDPIEMARRHGQEAPSEPAQSGYWPVLFIAGLSIGAFALIVAYLQV